MHPPGGLSAERCVERVVVRGPAARLANVRVNGLTFSGAACTLRRYSTVRGRFFR